MPAPSSPFATFAWSSPPPTPRAAPIEQTGTGLWVGIVLLLIAFGLGALAGYGIGRMNVLLPLLEWLDGVAR